MGKQLHILANYNDGQYVTVEGKENQERLRLLGDFGIDFEERRRREFIRQGLQDNLPRQIDDTIKQYTTELSLHEAFFLTSALGCLEINGRGKKKLDITTCWTKFREFHNQSNNRLDFALEYATYYYFRTLGWTIKSGANYGVHFLLYDDSVSTSHSKYAVLVIDDSTSGHKPTWMHLLTKHRVAQSVNKKLLVALVKSASESHDRPDCIQSFEIALSSFTGNTSIQGCLSN